MKKSERNTESSTPLIGLRWMPERNPARKCKFPTVPENDRESATEMREKNKREINEKMDCKHEQCGSVSFLHLQYID